MIMSLRLVKLICIPCCVLVVLLAFLAETQASSCLSSAAAVKEAFPHAWPHWTVRSQSHDGVKCWHPGTRAAAHRSRVRTVHHQNPAASPKGAAVVHLDDAKNPVLSTVDFGETSGTRWSLQASAASAEMGSASGQSSFAERFAAVFEVILFERPSVMRRMEGLLSTAR